MFMSRRSEPSLQLRRSLSERGGGPSLPRGRGDGPFEDREVEHGEGRRGLMHELERDLLGVDQGAISPLARMLHRDLGLVGDSRLDAGLRAWFLLIGVIRSLSLSLTGSLYICMILMLSYSYRWRG